VVVIGGGPAGLAAAARCNELGLETLLIEYGDRLGGIPLQCIHPGFGIHYFREDLTGTEYVQRFIDRVVEAGVDTLLQAYVERLELTPSLDKRLTVLIPGNLIEVEARTVIYAAGAREKHLYEIGVAGARCGGIYTAGEAQAMMDLWGMMPSREVVVIGSGDVGLIVARRLALEGANVKAVVEMRPYPGGLMRNIVQCLKDFGVPLLLSHVVSGLKGRDRVERVVVQKVDANGVPIPGETREIECDTVIVSAGLTPNVKLLEKAGVLMDDSTGGPVVNDFMETSMPGVFAAGNAVLINDYVDYVTEQGERAAEGAKLYIDNNGLPSYQWRRIVKGRNVRVAVPQLVSGERDVYLYARVAFPEVNVKMVFREIGRELSQSIVRPAEMLRLKLSAKEIAAAEDRLTLEVVPA